MVKANIQELTHYDEFPLSDKVRHRLDDLAKTQKTNSRKYRDHSTKEIY